MPQPRVLVVDDEPQVLDVLERILTTAGYQPEMFQSATALLECIAADDRGCVVTDLQMPGMNGIELQAELLTRKSCLSLIVVTGHADVQRAIQIMGQGAVMLLEKPFKAHQLITEVQQAVQLSERNYAKRQQVLAARAAIAQLNEDEVQVMQLAAQGLPNKAISFQLSLSLRTVDRRRQSALLKLGAASVAEYALLMRTAEEDQ